MERQEIIRRLETRLTESRERRERARAEFDAYIAGAGLPHPDGALAIKKSAREYERAIRAAQKALEDQVNFVTRGIVPPPGIRCRRRA